jgi:hypothetical protein
MATTDLYRSQPLYKGFVNFGKQLLQILVAIVMAFLGFWFILAAHEGPHILADTIVFVRHGASVDALEVRALWLTVEMDVGHWTARWGSWGSFFPPATTEFVHTRDPLYLTDREIGFSNLAGCGMTALISLIALTVLNLRKNVRRISWSTVTIVLWAVIFDQLLYTFISPDPEPLVSAVQMGINPTFFKGLVIGLALLQVWLLIRYVLHYCRSRRAAKARVFGRQNKAQVVKNSNDYLGDYGR